MTGSQLAIVPKVAKILPILGSDKDGEILAAAQALRRALRGAGFDLHDLVAAVERGWSRDAPPEPQRQVRGWWQRTAESCLSAGGYALTAAELEFVSWASPR